MIAKLIICQVAPDQRANFSLAQQAWQATNQSQGFAGQIGGWELNTNKAVMIAQWDSKAAVANFMNTLHDKIVAENNQPATYRECQVQYFDLAKPLDIHLMPLDQASYLTISNVEQTDRSLIIGLSDQQPSQRLGNDLLVRLEKSWLISPLIA